MSKLSWVVSMVVVVMALSWSSLPSAQAQEETPTCADNLNPCGPFINSTMAKPPATCCTPLAVVLRDELPCICNILSNVDLIQALSINVIEAVTLPSRCGIELDLVSECQALLAPSMAPAMAPSPTAHLHLPSDSDATSPSPVGSFSSLKGKKKSAASNLSKIGSVLGSALLLTTMMFY